MLPAVPRGRLASLLGHLLRYDDRADGRGAGRRTGALVCTRLGQGLYAALVLGACVLVLAAYATRARPVRVAVGRARSLATHEEVVRAHAQLAGPLVRRLGSACGLAALHVDDARHVLVLRDPEPVVMANVEFSPVPKSRVIGFELWPECIPPHNATVMRAQEGFVRYLDARGILRHRSVRGEAASCLQRLLDLLHARWPCVVQVVQ